MYERRGPAEQALEDRYIELEAALWLATEQRRLAVRLEREMDATIRRLKSQKRDLDEEAKVLYLACG